MANLINILETCWYKSPPWDNQIPALAVSLLEKVYIPNPVQIVGYCAGVEWSEEGWIYSVASERGLITVSADDITPTGQILPLKVEKPQFRLGQLVNFRFANDGPPIRTILGLTLVNESWLYQVEWRSPSLRLSLDEGVCLFPKSTQPSKFIDRLSWVTPYDLSEV
ncbi:DUF1392 family protein [Anabaena azotica]|uniref:DUF1392 family protein n=1 Tax=Anabaena azotica FACHB-119 TaxID=947527 RepID=A0ABR8DDQ1_9NOST|nr:DUF1392 family protein [Anabaena azotica]MBD2505096.1 DUF1392 family protein [Anabaena azotica FACHB-119]